MFNLLIVIILDVGASVGVKTVNLTPPPHVVPFVRHRNLDGSNIRVSGKSF